MGVIYSKRGTVRHTKQTTTLFARRYRSIFQCIYGIYTTTVSKYAFLLYLMLVSNERPLTIANSILVVFTLSC